MCGGILPAHFSIDIVQYSIDIDQNTVGCRPAARKRSQNDARSWGSGYLINDVVQPFLSNSSVNTLQRQRISTQQ
jgi:hypothetical protein